MLQNRVDPFGNIIATTARGSLMGNRGVIHNESKQITRAFRHKAWISCKLEFKNRKRAMMTAGRWTELFFLDEATALSAGHRPCFECRREDAEQFKRFWIHGNPQNGFNMKASIKLIDEVIHAERIDVRKNKLKHRRTFSDIPDGVFVEINNDPYLVFNRKLYRWTSFGYQEIPSMDDDFMTVLTPVSIANAIQAGYVPLMPAIVPAM